MPSITDGDRFISGAVITSEDVELLDGDPETLNAHLPAKGVIRAHSITPVNMNNRPKDNGWAQLMQHNRKGDYYFISFSLSLSLSLSSSCSSSSSSSSSWKKNNKERNRERNLKRNKKQNKKKGMDDFF